MVNQGSHGRAKTCKNMYLENWYTQFYDSHKFMQTSTKINVVSHFFYLGSYQNVPKFGRQSVLYRHQFMPRLLVHLRVLVRHSRHTCTCISGRAMYVDYHVHSLTMINCQCVNVCLDDVIAIV